LRQHADRRDRNRRTTMICAREQSLGHSAHIGHEVEVHYRWHALYGRRIRRQYTERRAGGEVVHVEVAPGVVVVVAAWMLDPATCGGMELGAPRVTLSALAELHQLLIEYGFRRSSSDGPTIVQEERHENPAAIDASISSPAPARHPIRIGKAARDDRGGAPDFAHQAGQPVVAGRRHRRRGA
jgi:hypothetical protein